MERTRPVLVERPIYRDEPGFREERRKKVVPDACSLAFVNAFGRLKTSVLGYWVEIPPGTFRMGESGRTQEVTITRPFKLLSVPITQALYGHLMGTNPSRFKGQARPVEMVSWVDAVKCCNALSTTLGLPEAYRIRDKAFDWEGLDHPGVRLPTEAEWEYACRAGTTGDYLDDMAWYGKNSENQTHPVGQKKPNIWGLYDMHGNVNEWCWDRYGDDLPSGKDPIGPASGWVRVLRGGGWYDSAIRCRVAYRCDYLADVVDYGCGFRFVLPPGL